MACQLPERSHLIIIELLASGSFGKVWKVRHDEDRQYYAGKQISVDKSLQQFQNDINKLKREVETLSKLNHANVIKYHDSWYQGPDKKSILNSTYSLPETGSSAAGIPEGNNFLYIQLELCQETLREWIKSNKIYQLGNTQAITNIMTQLASGLKEVHSAQILHRDLKPENIFVKVDSKGEYIWKIGDFGLCATTDKDHKEHQSFVGTMAYQSPEMKAGKRYGKPSDVFSLGLVFLEMIHDFKDNERYSVIFDIQEGGIPQCISDSFKSHPNKTELISGMLHREPDARWKIDTILEQLISPKANLDRRGEIPANFTSEIKCGNKKLTIPDDGNSKTLSFEVGLSSANFVGRAGELERLHKLFKSGNHIIITITGMGGVGKSELAKRFSNQIYNSANCIWLEGDNNQTLKNSLKRLGKELLGSEEKKLDVLDILDLWNFVIPSLTSFSKHHLLIIDNVDSSYTEVEKLLSHKTFEEQGNHWLRIVTSRNATVLKSIGEIIKVEELSIEDAMLLVRQSLPDEEDNDVSELCKTYQNFPLALQQAVAFIKEQKNVGLEQYSIPSYLLKYNDCAESKNAILDRSLNNMEHKYKHSTRTTWKISIEKLFMDEDAVGKLAIKMINYIAFFEPDGIRLEFLKLLHANSSETMYALEKLKAYSLLKAEKGLLSIHRLMQEVHRLFLIDMPSEFGNGKIETLHNMATDFRNVVDKLELYDISHAICFWKHILSLDGAFIQDFFDLPISIALKLDNLSSYRTMEEFTMNCYSKFRTIFPKNHHLKIKSHLARALQFNSKYEEALCAYREIYEVSKTREDKGKSHMKKTLTAQRLMGVNLWYLHRLQESSDILTNLLERSEKIFGTKDQTTVGIKNDLALVLLDRGHIPKSIELFKDVYKSTGSLVSKMNYGNGLLRLGDFQTAMEDLEDTVKQMELLEGKGFGKNHYRTLSAKYSYGASLYLINQSSKGIQILTEVYKSQTEILGEGHVHTNRTRITISVCKFFKPLYAPYSPVPRIVQFGYCHFLSNIYHILRFRLLNCLYFGQNVSQIMPENLLMASIFGILGIFVCFTWCML